MITCPLHFRQNPAYGDELAGGRFQHGNKDMLKVRAIQHARLGVEGSEPAYGCCWRYARRGPAMSCGRSSDRILGFPIPILCFKKRDAWCGNAMPLARWPPLVVSTLQWFKDRSHAFEEGPFTSASLRPQILSSNQFGGMEPQVV